MTLTNVTGHSAFAGVFSLKMYTSPYLWSDATEIDLTEDVKLENSTFSMNMSKDHTLKLRLINHNFNFFDTTSDYYMFKGKRIKLTFNAQNFKMKVSKAPYNISDDYVSIECSHHSVDLNGHTAQIRVTPNSDGNIYLEDVLFKALYDTGLYNQFWIKNEDGDVYSPGGEGISKHPVSVESELVYWNMTVREILDDLCSRSGCMWYCTDVAGSDIASYLNIVDILNDYETPTDKIITLSGDKNMMDIQIDIDRTSITNKIIIDNMGVRIFDEDSIDEYGPSKPMILSMPTDANVSNYIDYVNKYISYSKDPEISINYKCNFFVDITDPYYTVKVVDSDYNYNNSIGIDRKYRVSSCVFNLAGNYTTIVGGTLARTMMLDKLTELLQQDTGTTSEDESRNLIKGGSVKIQVQTNRQNISNLETASDAGLHGVRIGVDYVYESTVSNGTVFYMDDDGIRNGVVPGVTNHVLQASGLTTGTPSIGTSTLSVITAGEYAQDISQSIADLGSGKLSYNDCGRKAFRRSDGRVFLVFENEYSSTDNIHIYYADSPYTSWTSARLTSDTGGAANQKLFLGADMDSNGILHIVWSGTHSTPSSTGLIRYMAYNTNTSTNTVNPTTVCYYDGSHQQTEPVVKCDSNDIAHIAWRGQGWQSGSAIYQVCYTNSGERLTEWPFAGSGDPPTVLTTSTSNNYMVNIDVDEDNDIHLFWVGQDAVCTNNTTDNVLYRISTNGGTSFGSVAKATDESTDTGPLGMCCSRDGSDTIHIVYHRGTTTYYNVYDGSWGSEDTVETNTDVNSTGNIILQDGNQVPCVMWNDQDSYDRPNVSIKQEGTTWEDWEYDDGDDDDSQVTAGKTWVYPQADQDYNVGGTRGPEFIYEWIDDNPASNVHHIYYKSFDAV